MSTPKKIAKPKAPAKAPVKKAAPKKPKAVRRAANKAAHKNVSAAPVFYPLLVVPQPPPPPEPTPMERVEAFGIDAIVDLVMAGELLTQIAANHLDVSLTTLRRFINADTDRARRMRDARSNTAQIYDEQAELVLRDAKGTKEEISRANAIAQHLRWRASKVNPKDYGDKVEIDNKHSFQAVTDEELVKALADFGIVVPPLGAATQPADGGELAAHVAGVMPRGSVH